MSMHSEATVVLNGRIVIVSLDQSEQVGTVRVSTDSGQAYFESPDLRNINFEQCSPVDGDGKASRDGVVAVPAVSDAERVRRAINSAATSTVSDLEPDAGIRVLETETERVETPRAYRFNHVNADLSGPHCDRLKDQPCVVDDGLRSVGNCDRDKARVGERVEVVHDSSPCSACGALSVGEQSRRAGGVARPSADQLIAVYELPARLNAIADATIAAPHHAARASIVMTNNGPPSIFIYGADPDEYQQQDGGTDHGVDVIHGLGQKHNAATITVWGAVDELLTDVLDRALDFVSTEVPA